MGVWGCRLRFGGDAGVVVIGSGLSCRRGCRVGVTTGMSESVWGGVRIVGLLVALGGGGEARGQLGGSEQGQADHGRELLISATQADSV